jgi:hypothetical protein
MRFKGKVIRFKGYSMEDWVKILAIRLYNNRFMRYVPVEVLIKEALPSYEILERLILDKDLMIDEIINDGWKKEDLQRFLEKLKAFLDNYNKPNKEVEP